MAIGIVKSVEECFIPIAGGLTIVDYSLTKGQDYTNCVPFASWRQPGVNNDPREFLLDVIMQSGPQVRLQRHQTGIALEAVVYVVEFEPSKVKVQQGIWEIVNSAYTDTVTLGDTIDKSSSAMIAYNRYNAGEVPGYFQCGRYIKSNTQVEFQRWHNPTTVCYGHYYVFEALNGEFSVSHYDTGNFATGAAWYDMSIVSVDTVRTFIIGWGMNSNTSWAMEENSFIVRLKDSVTVGFQKFSSTADTNRFWVQVIECADDSIFVQHRYAYLDNSTVYDDWTIPQPVDPATSIAWNPNPPYSMADGSPWENGLYRNYIHTSGTKVRSQRYLPSIPDDDGYIYVSAIEFTGTAFYCEGTVRVDGALTSGIDVNLYRREDDMFLGHNTTTVSGTFAIPSRFHEEHHYILAKSTVSGTNSAVLDWLLSP